MPPLSTQRLIELEEELTRAVAERRAEEERIAAAHASAGLEADRLRERRRREVDEHHNTRRESDDGESQGRHAMLTASHEATRVRTQEEYRARRAAAETEANESLRRAADEQKNAAWEIHTCYEVAKKKPPAKRHAARGRAQELRSGLAVVVGEAVGIARDRGLRDASYDLAEPNDQPPEDAASTDAACRAADEAATRTVDAAREAAQALYDQPLPRAMTGVLPASVFAVALAALVPALGLTLGWDDWRAYAGALGGATAVATGVYLGLRPKSLRQTREGFAAACERFAQAETALSRAAALAEARCDRELRELREQRDTDRRELEARVTALVEEAGAKRQRVLGEIREHYPALLTKMRNDHESALAELAREEHQRIAETTLERDRTLAQIEAEHAAQHESIDDTRDAAWQAMFERWLTRYDNVRAELRDARSQCQRLFPDFATVAYGAGPAADGDPSAWAPPSEAPAAIAFGQTEFDLRRIEHGLSPDERLHPPEHKLAVPALWTLAEDPNLLLTAHGEGRAKAVELLRAVMLRVLTAFPPGKVRFTLLDPIGLGENFQAMMHLADADEQLVAGQIWSQTRDIDEQLARLTTHMETVLQKYLRSEYETIHDYNAQAGEVAEPLQVLVVAGFPANFSEQAARRLVSLVTGGPRCGVHTLMSVDTAARQPTDFRLDDVKANAAWLDWDNQHDGGARFVWRRPELEHWPLELAAEPPTDRVIDTVRRAGQAAKAAIRVEVPFAAVEPEGGALWQGDSSVELCVPIGRAGAKKLQHVRLGRGTSQHVLVAGKTGSGKSTFLHALVTSAAMHFSPREVEFYLIDFKKGVEFKSYATHRLPHARVIAIESEREFGLSVLERLDQELGARGEKFREAGVQNLADYRDARPDDPAPRVLLVIDEFQELFTEDDRLAQEASLLLDRLVRQGRAFGMHVVLGTQTLAGAYSIARSTLGQIAVRVALECGEADAHLILSDERNNAARFLSRPGEAIYNAQNGMLSANEPFQVVWLPDAQRAAKLDIVDEQRHTAGLARPDTIVFEGSAPADPQKNGPLAALLAGEAAPAPAGRPTPAWLGASVAIKPPAAVEFGRHPGANLLVVGADESAALGMLTTAAVSLAAAQPDAKIVVLDATRPGEEADGVWRGVIDALPCETELVDLAGVGRAMAALAETLAERESQADDPSRPAPPPIYFVLHNAGRFRELRKREDDYGFGMSSDEPKKPDAILGDLLKNGPSVGVHVLAWCDSYNSASRLFDRQAMREFALRVVMQMSAGDSSHLIDTPAASDLNLHRALLYNDETGLTEKFRPYAAPTEAWLAAVRTADGVRAE